MDIIGDNMRLCRSSSTALSTKESQLVRRAFLDAHVVGGLSCVRASGITGQIQTALLVGECTSWANDLPCSSWSASLTREEGANMVLAGRSASTSKKPAGAAAFPRPGNQALMTAECKSLCEEGVFHAVQIAQNVNAATRNPANDYAHESCAKEGDRGWLIHWPVRSRQNQSHDWVCIKRRRFSRSEWCRNAAAAERALQRSSNLRRQKAVSLTSAQMAFLLSNVRLSHAERSMSISPSQPWNSTRPNKERYESRKLIFGDYPDIG